jgi:ATP-dependent RNA helicase DOB1
VLSSKFHLGYNMLLNCVRVETVDVEMLIQKSFYTFQQQKALPELRAELHRLGTELAAPELTLAADAQAAHELHGALYAERSVRDELRAIVNKPIHSLPFLQAGRLAQVRAPSPGSDEYNAGCGLGDDWGWGIIVTFKKRGAGDDGKKSKQPPKGNDAGGPIENTTVDVLLPCAVGAEERIADGQLPRPANDGRPRVGDAVVIGEEGVEMQVVTVPLTYIDRLSSVRIKLPADLRGPDARFGMLKVLKEVGVRFVSGVPLLSPTDEMRVSDERVPKLMRKLETAQAKLDDERLTAPDVITSLPTLHRRLAIGASERNVRTKIKEVEAVLMADELKARRRVLRRLGHLSEEGVIQNKGRVACEVRALPRSDTSALSLCSLSLVRCSDARVHVCPVPAHSSRQPTSCSRPNSSSLACSTR